MWIDLVQGITYFILSYFLFPALPGMAWKQLQTPVYTVISWTGYGHHYLIWDLTFWLPEMLQEKVLTDEPFLKENKDKDIKYF